MLTAFRTLCTMNEGKEKEPKKVSSSGSALVKIPDSEIYYRAVNEKLDKYEEVTCED